MMLSGVPPLFHQWHVRANPAKIEDFGDKDLLQHIDLARILFGEVIPPRREAR
jgi:hypothetical protein